MTAGDGAGSGKHGLDWSAWDRQEEAERVEKKIRAAKRAARSELSVSKGEWRKHGYAESPLLVIPEGLEDGLPRVDAREVTFEEFADRFERPGRPCVITGLTDDWPATHRWKLEELEKNYGNTR